MEEAFEVFEESFESFEGFEAFEAFEASMDHTEHSLCHTGSCHGNGMIFSRHLFLKRPCFTLGDNPCRTHLLSTICDRSKSTSMTASFSVLHSTFGDRTSLWQTPCRSGSTAAATELRYPI